MNALISKRVPLQAAILCLAGVLLLGCRKANKPQRIGIEELKVELAPELQVNRIGGMSSVVGQQFKASAIHWQPWEPEVFDRAKAAKRLIFCVIALPQHPGFSQAMRDLESDPSVVEIINANYIPVLIDADLSREFEVLSADLAEEISRPIAFPMFVWLDYERNFVASTPVSSDNPGGVYQTFTQSHAMIAPMWEDDLELWMVDGAPGYVLSNSAHDQRRRQKRYQARIDGRKFSDDPKRDVPRALRQLISNYDPYTQSISHAGEAVPVRVIKLLADASMRDTLPQELRDGARNVVQSLLDHLLPSPMFDPLDGGAFSRRSAKSWSLPAFVKDGASQAGIAEALLCAHQATGDPKALERALVLIDLLERDYLNADGLFVLAPSVDRDPQKWMWTIAEIRGVLGDEDARWWVRMTGMEELGNLPLETDPTRLHFRKNAIGARMPLAALAAEFGVPLEEMQRRHQAARAKLLATRDARMRVGIRDGSAHFKASFAMVSVHARAYQVTGNPDHLRKAKELMTRCRDAFGADGSLHACRSEGTSAVSQARAYHYALAINAALDLHELAADGQWDRWAEALLQEFIGRFVDGKLVQECPPGIRIVALPIEDRKMLAEDSTLGLIAITAARLKGLGKTLPAGLVDVAEGLPVEAMEQPALYAGQLMGAIQRLHPLQRAATR